MREFGISDRMIQLATNAEQNIKERIQVAEKICEYNQLKVLAAFHKNRISAEHFIPTSGYGYDDAGREAIDEVFADIFRTESALVRHNIISGTHAISLGLFGILRPGDTLLCATGAPYDTLKETIGIVGNDGNGSLKDFGVHYEQIDLVDGKINLSGILEVAKKEEVKLILIQKSKGYDYRESLSSEEIGHLIKKIKEINPYAICMVDNCYGEFVETTEPTDFGADLVAGSLIKNPGGGLAPTGGYLAGKEEYIELASYKLNAVGMGRECGATLNFNKAILQGVFMAPNIVFQAVSSAIFCSEMCRLLGYDTLPKPEQHRSDIIQAIRFGDKHKVIEFCKGIQGGAPIDSFVTPVPWEMPGYQDQVIMAAGTFVQGSSIELSADAPIRSPYVAYMQGGLTYHSAKIGILKGLSQAEEEGNSPKINMICR